MNATDWKLDLVDSTSLREIKTFKNTVRLNNSNEENRRTFQNVQDGRYFVRLVPFSADNKPGIESKSNEIVIGLDNQVYQTTTSSNITGYTPFPSSTSPAIRTPSVVTPSNTGTTRPQVSESPRSNIYSVSPAMMTTMSPIIR
jgi:hypothetical protein